MEQVLLVGEDNFFHSRDLHDSHNIIHVESKDEAISMIGRFDFDAIIAADGEQILKEVRAQGKHTPFLNISNKASMIDCCGGHLSPSATTELKGQVLAGLMNRNHDTDCA